ncbi:DUF4494 family protein [Tellurirhabdus bombi]|uniref:DUF4494 family protein n=1 Tax=Tellurirhabdus bombi TaxID=2907205 RepID=UPI001F236427|nr:DUF4494 family protein [Tellurirhabdus bombi]
MWYQSKIKYGALGDDMKRITRTEVFLHEAITYAEVEAQLYTILEGRVKDFDYSISDNAKFSAVYDTFAGGDFYKVKVVEEIGDKKRTLHHLVAASDVADAQKRVEAYLKNSLIGFTIDGATKSAILGVWNPASEDWQNDFKQRMEDLREAGHESVGINQLEIDFKKRASEPAAA